MTKVPQTETALAVQNNVLDLIPSAEDIDDGFEAPSTGEYLPFLEMVFPVMVTPDKPWYRGHEYQIGFVNGGKFVPLTEDSIITVIDKRNSVRAKSEGASGSVKNEYAYSAINRKGQVFEKSAARYNELAATTDPNTDKGFSMAVAVVMPDNSVLVADFSAYKTMTSYMYGALAPAMLGQKIGMRVGIQDHTPNLTKSKNGKFYPVARNFKQWSHVQLTPTQLKAIVGAINEKAAEYMNWLGR